MGYRDDFYVSDNIIGYSGMPSDNPTVYFRNGTTFGRITQAHDDATNVGRAEVRTYADYRIGNELYDGQMACVEFYSGAIQHVSRSTITFMADLRAKYTDALSPLLAQAIVNFPNAKPKYGF